MFIYNELLIFSALVGIYIYLLYAVYGQSPSISGVLQFPTEIRDKLRRTVQNVCVLLHVSVYATSFITLFCYAFQDGQACVSSLVLELMLHTVVKIHWHLLFIQLEMPLILAVSASLTIHPTSDVLLSSYHLLFLDMSRIIYCTLSAAPLLIYCRY